MKPSDIDAYWLQRQVAAAFGYTDSDAAESSKMAEEVLAALGCETDDERACENRLVLLLDYDKFDLIKKLKSARVWCGAPDWRARRTTTRRRTSWNR